MLKILAMLSMSLAIVQASIPSPRTTVNPKGSTTVSENQGANSEHQQYGAKSPVPGQLPRIQAIEQQANQEHHKDAWDKAAVLASYLLIAVGVFGVIYAARTLRTLKAQTAATQDAATSALAQIQLMKSKERARLDIKPGRLEVCGEEDGFWYLSADIELCNAGPSNAYVTRSQGTFLILQSNEVPTIGGDEPRTLDMQSDIIPPSLEPIHLPFWFEDVPYFMSEFLSSISSGEQVMFVIGFIEYETLGTTWHRDFTYEWIADTSEERAAKYPGSLFAPKTVGEEIQDGFWERNDANKNGEYEIKAN